ncbi:hypothetical protein QVD17_21584 [Tagetes erecta]|uniref:Peptidase C1A papain C-terminal domain-containing protein n=1 Tax=Tagetes erecta TaxID=13708 RepID=A0AAD8KCK4_TARER|nr:hypothetical protein QVD17_21584 [Tagetes erecta]
MADFEIERKYTSQVSNQKDDGCCMDLVIADLFFECGGNRRSTSACSLPQLLIEDGTVPPYHFDDFVKEIGLEYIHTFPFTCFKRRDWNKEHMYMGEFGDNKIIRDMEVLKIPYHPPGKKSTRKRRKPTKGNKEIPEYKHALLMVGCNTTHEDPKMHYCIVKNSYGLKWGTKGFSLVEFDALEFIMVPKYKLDEEDVLKVGCSTQIHEMQSEDDASKVLACKRSRRMILEVKICPSHIRNENYCSKWDTSLDREDDEDMVLKKCIFVSDLSLFAEISYIISFFNDLNLMEWLM